MVALVTPLRPLLVAPSSGLKCSACGFLLIRPKQTECGHRYCTACAQDLFRTQDEVSCHVCQEKLSPSKFHNDRAAENDTLVTEVKCPNVGCTWQGLLKTYLNTHQQECSFVPEPCPNATFGCSFVGGQAGMKMHLDEECQWRMVSCPRCSVSVPTSLLKDHMCSPTDKGDISLQDRSCPRKSEIHKQTLGHRPEDNEPHLITLLAEVYNLQARMDRHETVNTTFKQLVMDKLVSLTGTVSRITGGDNVDVSRQEQNEQKMQSLEETVAALRQDLQKQLSAMEVMQQRCLEYEKVIHGLQSRGGQAAGSQDPVSSNGILVWKIENVSSLMRSAKAEQRTSYYSRAFCTHSFGYRLCCRLYPNGDGSGKGTHISLFLVIMRGDYDDVLHWPFKQKVTFLVLDQTHQQRPFRESFVPDAASASFHKPKSHMNVASGSPQFLKHNLLLASGSPYLRNDTFYIKVVVDPTGLDL